MLLNLREYRRPAAEGGDVHSALALLARREIHTVPLAGGDALVGSGDRSVEAVVDLQGLGLDALRVLTAPAGVELGALATRSDLVNWPAQLNAVDTSPAVLRLVEFLAAAARRWGGNVQRNRATVAGAIVTAGPDDALVAALLACGATMTLETPAGARTVALADVPVLPDAPAIITSVHVPAQPAGYALETVARTPADTPIVLAAACIGAASSRLALGGVAAAPVLVTLKERVTAATAGDIAARVAGSVQPTGDFRGSAEYRRAMVRVLSERALLAALEGAS